MDEIHILQLQISSIVNLVEKEKFNFTSSLLLKYLKIGGIGKRGKTRRQSRGEEGEKELLLM